MSDPGSESRAGLVAITVPLVVAAAIALAAFTPALGWLRTDPPLHFHGRDVTPENWGAPFTLTDPAGHRVSLADQKGKAVLLAFGYTHCPDACPATLARLAEVRRLIGRNAQQVQVLFVTIDPERDTGPMLGRYVTAFDPTFIGLRGTDAETDAVTTAFHADYQIMKYNGEVLVGHSVETYLIDPTGHMRVVMPNRLSAREVADDVRSVLAAPSNCWPWTKELAWWATGVSTVQSKVAQASQWLSRQ
jgi:protein SCO1